jgi:hypothetical protein
MNNKELILMELLDKTFLVERYLSYHICDFLHTENIGNWRGFGFSLVRNAFIICNHCTRLQKDQRNIWHVKKADWINASCLPTSKGNKV